jgi:hypothetical protein
MKIKTISIDGTKARSGNVKTLFFLRKVDKGVSFFFELNYIQTGNGKLSFYSFPLNDGNRELQNVKS